MMDSLAGLDSDAGTDIAVQERGGGMLLLEALLAVPATPRRRTAAKAAPSLQQLEQLPQLAEPRALRDVEAPVHLGHLVRRVRRERKLTQGELAQFTGTGRRFISELENGKQTLEFGLVLRVCSAMGIEVTARKR